MAVEHAAVPAEEISFEEFLTRYDGERAEWVRGRVVAMSPVNRRH